MTDKEVGEIWREEYDWEPKHEIRRLIRKLVEERAWTIAKGYYRDNLVERTEMLSCVKAACRDFGIDPETWTNE